MSVDRLTKKAKQQKRKAQLMKKAASRKDVQQELDEAVRVLERLPKKLQRSKSLGGFDDPLGEKLLKLSKETLEFTGDMLDQFAQRYSMDLEDVIGDIEDPGEDDDE